MSKHLLAKLSLLFLLGILLCTSHAALGFAQQLSGEKPSSPSGPLVGTKDQESEFEHEKFIPMSSPKGIPVRKTLGRGEDVEIDKHKRLFTTQSDEQLTYEEPVTKVKGLASTIQVHDFRGYIEISESCSEARMLPASMSALKAWGFQPETVGLFNRLVKVSVRKELGKTWVSVVEIKAPSDEVFITKGNLFCLYDAVKKTNDRDTLNILGDSLYTAGASWDFCKYNWGKKYIGLTFFKEGPTGKPVEVSNLSFPASLYPMAQKIFDRALVATWWLDIAKSAKEEDAKALRDEAAFLLEVNF